MKSTSLRVSLNLSSCSKINSRQDVYEKVLMLKKYFLTNLQGFDLSVEGVGVWIK